MIKYDHDKKITVLVNSIHFFFDYVYIVFLNKRYTLIVIHHYKMLINKEYKTLRGAKIAFIRFFGYKAFENKKALWSYLYHPILGWHEDNIARTN